LLAAVPGARVRAGASVQTLEAAVETCAQVAATLHGSRIRQGPRRSVKRELDELGSAIRAVRPRSPALAARLERALERAAAQLQATRPLASCLAHGDFTSSQFLFHGRRPALVDFDTICQAEPALDLGQFIAYLRFTLLKRGTDAALADELAARFLDAYAAMGERARAERARLEARVAGYEVISLLRMALHGWQKFKPDRVSVLVPLLGERASCLPVPKR
jgi:aminoglycoside phosphotransferase (APT) family kinase protein